MKSPEEYIDGLTGTHPNYDQGQTLNGYHTSDRQFPNPNGMVKFLGFGMNEQDYDRGFCDPKLSERPEYDSQNYVYRYSETKTDDLVENGPGLPEDYAFRNEERVSKGFLTRPRIPTER